MSFKQLFNDKILDNLKLTHSLTIPRVELSRLPIPMENAMFVFNVENNGLYYSQDYQWTPIVTGLISSLCGESLISTTGPIIELKSLIAGTGVIITSDDECITISSTGSGGGTGITTLSSTGGTSLVVSGVGPNLSIKGLTAGPGISFQDAGGSIAIINTGGLSSSSTTFLYSAGGTSLVASSTGPNLYIKGLVAGSGISLSGNLSSLTITNNTDLSSRAGTSLVFTGSGPNLVIKGLTAGPGISLQDAGGSIAIINTGGLNTIGTTFLYSAGGTSLVASSTGPNLYIKGLVAGSGISLSGNLSSITITNNTDLSNRAGTSLVFTGSGPNLVIKGLTAGPGISLQDAGGSIAIINSGALTAAATTFLYSAGGTSLVASSTGPNLYIKGLLAGTGVVLSSDLSSVTISTDITLSSAGTPSLVVWGTGPDLVIKGIQAGDGISISTIDNNFLTISSSSAASAINLFSTNGLVGLVQQGSGPDMLIKALNAGPGISLQDAGGSVAIINTGSLTAAATTFLYSASNTSLVASSTGPNLYIKGLVAGSGISLSGDLSSITIINNTDLSSRAGTSLVFTGSGPNLVIKGLTAGPGISLQDAGGSIAIINTGGLSSSSTTFLYSAGGTSLVAFSTGPNLYIKGLLAGTGISLSGDLSSITITNSNYPLVYTVTSSSASFVTLGTLPTTTDKPAMFDVNILARSNVDNSSDGFFLQGAYSNVAGTVTKIGADQIISFRQNLAWNVQSIASSPNILIQVQGDGTSITWTGYVKEYIGN